MYKSIFQEAVQLSAELQIKKENTEFVPIKSAAKKNKNMQGGTRRVPEDVFELKIFCDKFEKFENSF